MEGCWWIALNSLCQDPFGFSLMVNSLAPLQSFQAKLRPRCDFDPRPERWPSTCIVPGLADQHHCLQVLWGKMTEHFLKHLCWQVTVPLSPTSQLSVMCCHFSLKSSGSPNLKQLCNKNDKLHYLHFKTMICLNTVTFCTLCLLCCPVWTQQSTHAASLRGCCCWRKDDHQKCVFFCKC